MKNLDDKMTVSTENCFESIEAYIHGMSNDGRGVARLDSGMTVFVEGAVTGQTVYAKVTSKKKRLMEAICTELIKKSPFEIPSYCKHAVPNFSDFEACKNKDNSSSYTLNSCGGCPLMSLSYDKQLEEKTDLIRNALIRIGHFKEFESEWAHRLLPILSAKDLPRFQDTNLEKMLTRYRNKMAFAFQVVKSHSLSSSPLFSGAPVTTKIGLKKHASHEIFEVSDCKLQKSISMELVKEVRAYCKNKDLSFLRYLVVRTPSTGKVTVELITWPFSKSKNTAQLEANCVHDLAKTVLALSGVDGFLHSIRASKVDVAYGERIMREWGETELSENIKLNVWDKPHTFSLGNKSFFQVNTAMTEILYSVIYAFASHVLPEKNGSIWDIYCGVGSITACIAGLAAKNKKEYKQIGSLNKKTLNSLCHVENVAEGRAYNREPLVYGIESVSAATALARKNTNKYDFCFFETAEAKYLWQYFNKYEKPDLIVLDPPRAGLDDAAMDALLKSNTPYCIMVSCNPSTLARDLELLSQVYDICAIQPVDLFPHSAHVETVSLLSLKK